MYSVVLKEKRTHRFLVCYLKPKFDVRRSLKLFKDLNRRFDSSLTALTRHSQTLSNVTRVLCIMCVSHSV